MSYDKPTQKRVSESNHVGYTIKRNTTFDQTIIVALVFRDGEAIGSIRCNSEEEYEWLKKTMTRSRKSPTSESA